MSFQVVALYDFEAVEQADLTIVSGETLTVLRTDVGQGWWEGSNSYGKIGLFPADFVKRVTESVPPSMPPPVLQPQYDWPPSETNSYQQSQDTDDFEDDLFEDDSSQIGTNQPHQQAYSNYSNTIATSKPSSAPNIESSVAKKSLNRFSLFVKSGGESYILGSLKDTHVKESQKIRITLSQDGVCSWPVLSPAESYTVTVTSPKRESKLKGLKTFIAYQLSHSHTNLVVSRRYKHFDWLHERLTEKYCLIAIPPLPEKQVSGRYEEQFIEHRRVQLQGFVDWVCKHPVLAYSEVWQHFLNCTDEKLWKQGKRLHEKDDLVGLNFCLSLIAPEKNLLPAQVKHELDKNTDFVGALDAGIKGLTTICLEQSKKHQINKDFHKIGDSFFALGSAISLANVVPTSYLATALTQTGAAYKSIGKCYEEQPKLDWEPLSNKLYTYKGIIGGFPDIFTLLRGAHQKRRDCEKANMQPSQLLQIQSRTDLLTYAIMAELYHIKTELDIDVNASMQEFLTQQINFYENVVYTLKETRDLFVRAHQ